MVGLQDSLAAFYLRLRQVVLRSPTRRPAREDQIERAERQTEKRKLRGRAKAFLARRKVNTSQASTASKPVLMLLDLPVEIRLMIWEYAIGGSRFELVYQPQSQRPLIMDYYEAGGGIMAKYHADWKRFYYHLFLACTSRQIYHEVIDLLYSCNTFVSQDPYAITDFGTRCSRCHIVQSLELKWDLTPTTFSPIMEDDESVFTSSAWVDCFTVIQKSLRPRRLKLTFRVPLSDHKPHHDLMTDARWVQPLFLLEQVKKLELVFVVIRDSPRTKDGQLRTLERFVTATVLKLEANGNQVVSAIDQGIVDC